MTDASKGNLYHLVLGLPVDAASPNHYELLGLDARTSDPEVIKNAAADQNRKLLSWQNSDRYPEIRRLTLEIVHAKEVLLNEASRAAYDAGLGDWGIADAGPWIIEERDVKGSSEPLSVRCPECTADFKLRNRDLIGRRMPCPECGFRFTVRPQREPALLEAAPVNDETDSEAELAALGNFDDMEDPPASSPKRTERPRARSKAGDNIFEVKPLEDDYEDYESIDRRSPQRTRNRTGERVPPQSRRTASRRSMSDSPKRWPILWGGGLMAVGVVLLTGVVLQQIVSPFATIHADRFAYLPADCESVTYCRLGDLARSPFFQDHLTKNSPLRGAADQFRDRMGMELQDVDSIAIAVKYDKSAAPNVGFSKGPFWGLTFVAVVRSSEAWDRAKLIGPHTQSTTHNNLTYHTFEPESQPDAQLAFHLPDDRTLVVGSLAEVQAAMDTGGNSPEWPETEFLQAEYALVSARLPGSEPAGRSVPRAMRNNLVGKTIAHSAGSGLLLDGNALDFATFTTWGSEAEAAEYLSAAEEHEQQRRKRSPQLRKNGEPVVSRFVQHGRTVTLIQGWDEIPDAVSDGMLHLPLNLLASLGNRPSNIADRIDSQANPAPNTPPPNNPSSPPATPNDLAPAPDADSLDALIADLQDRDKARMAALKFVKMQPVPARQKEVVTLLEDLLRSPRGTPERLAAADALGVWGTSENVPNLLRVLKRNDHVLKGHVLAALAKIGDPKALPGLIDALRDLGDRPEAIKALESFPEAESELLKVLASLDSGNWQFQVGICKVLTKVGTSRSLPQLKALAASPAGPTSSSVRGAAITAINAISSRNQ